jgi:hypothetical protein
MMMILESPNFGVPRAEWEDWLAKLAAMPQNDPSVPYATKRAQAVLLRNDERQELLGRFAVARADALANGQEPSA